MAIVSMRIQARVMQRGDIVGSGETIVSVSAGARTPRGKVEVILDTDGRRRMAIWGAYTMIDVKREKDLNPWPQ